MAIENDICFRLYGADRHISLFGRVKLVMTAPMSTADAACEVILH